MDNYRNPMYNRYNRNMGVQHGTRHGQYVVPVVEAGNCGQCNKDTFASCIDSLPLAMAYVPMQKWRNVFDACQGLEHGTIFEELVKPWYGDKNMCGMRGDR